MKIKSNSIILPLPPKKLISENEMAWRIKLPDDYKKFIELNNGGIPEESIFNCNNRAYKLTRFLCILEDPEETELGMFDIDVTWSQLDERLTDDGDLIGVALLPIAVLFAGDFLCLDFRNSRENPIVCVWDHSNSNEFDPICYHVADSFEEFISLLR